MNLAEIRKKAVEARKPGGDDVRQAEESIRDESVGSGIDPLAGSDGGELDGDPSAFDFFPDSCEDETSYSESFETDPYMATDDIPPLGEGESGFEFDFTEAAPDLPDLEIELPRHDAPPEPSPMTAVSHGEPEAVPVRHPAYDPLAILLAGREAAEEGAELPSGESAQVSEEVEEYLCFKVADEEYALSIMAIKEIIKPREVTEVPRMPRFVSGVISLRGIIIPIMDMRLRLSLPVREATGRERILVLKTSNGLCGVLVDEVIQVVRILSSAIEEPPAILDGVDREFVMGLGRYDNRMLILLNLESILDLNVH